MNESNNLNFQIANGMMKHTRFLLFAIAFSLFACNSSTIKEKINQAGDVAGQTAGEFIEGASKGVQKAFDVKVELSESLKSKGIELGKSTVSSDSLGTDNLLSQYVIFNQDFSGTLTARVFDSSDKEMGRAAVEVEGKQKEARFIDFRFDPRTNIDSKCRLNVE